jgi:exo-rhamnogalacturonan lyase-like protein
VISVTQARTVAINFLRDTDGSRTCFRPFHPYLQNALRTTRHSVFRTASRRRRSWKSHVEALESRCLLAITSLSVENDQPFARVDEPVTSGVPIPQSLGLMNTNQLRILDSDNNVVLAQFRVLGRWNSGPNDTAAPIRWVEVHFAADVSANATATYQLDVGGTGNAPAAIQTNTSATFIDITTGPARFEINRDTFNLFDTVWLDLDNNGTFADSERIVTPNAEDGSFVRQGATEFRSDREAPLSVVLEESGPLRAVVRAEGFHSAANGSDLLRYVTRLTFFAGQSFVQVDHTIIEGRVLGAGNGDLDRQVRTDIDPAGLRINLALSGSVDVRSRGAQATVRTATLNSGSNAEVFQRRLTDINNPLSYEVRQNGAVVETGQQATRGWQDLSDSRWGLAGQWQRHVAHATPSSGPTIRRSAVRAARVPRSGLRTAE